VVKQQSSGAGPQPTRRQSRDREEAMRVGAKAKGNVWRRPRSLFEVVSEAESAEDIGYNLADFLDHVNALARQPSAARRVAASLRTEPAPTGDAVQDAYLAAVAAHLSHGLRLRAPAWTEQKNRRLDHPWFALPHAWARATLLRDSPAAFRERNLFTTEDALHRA